MLAQTRRLQPGSSVSKTPAQLTLSAKGNCFVLCAFQINFLPERTRERIGTPNCRKRESQATLMLELLVEIPIVRKTCN